MVAAGAIVRISKKIIAFQTYEDGVRAHGCLGDAVTSIGFIVVLVDN
jgi:hypothetical protein